MVSPRVQTIPGSIITGQRRLAIVRSATIVEKPVLWRGPALPRSHRAATCVVASASAAAAPSGNDSGLAAVAQAATNLFPMFVLGAATLGVAQPSSFDWFLPNYITPALGTTMLGMGLTLTFEDFRRVLSAPARIFAGFALQFTIMPALAFAISRLAALPLDFAVGLCVLGACPGGSASNIVTYLARADVPLSVAMTTASTMGAVVATPLLTKLLLGTLVPVDAAALLVSTLQVVLLPVLAGAALNQAFPRQVERLSPLAALSAVLLIAAICGSVMARNAAAAVAAGPRLLAAVAALHAGGFALGYAFSRALGLPEKAARTNSIEVGMQNSALGALLSATHFPAHPLAAVPCALSACTHSVMGSLLAAFWRSQRTDGEGAAGAAAGSQEEADAAARVLAVQKWIAAWRTQQAGGAKQDEPAVSQQLEAVQRWIAAWRARTPDPGFS